jgi:DNA-binding NarL/FixJ family response regulator
MLVADHPIMRDSLRRLLRQQADMDLVCELHDASAVAAALARFQPNILLLDLQSQHGEAQRAIDAVWTVSPLTPIVLLTTYPWDSEHLHPRAPDAVTALSKTAPGDEVIAVLRRAAGFTL